MAEADTIIGYENELAGQEMKLALALEADDKADAKYRRERIAAIEKALKSARSGAVKEKPVVKVDVEIEVDAHVKESPESASLDEGETATLEDV